MRKALVFFFVLHFFSAEAGNDSLRFFSRAPSFSKTRFAWVAGGESALWAGSVAALSQVWYKDYGHSPFHFFNDNAEWMGMDKAGHFTTSATIGRMGIDLLHWSGVSDQRSRIYGGMLGFTYLATLEVFDGYSQGWGFSWGDIGSNLAGAGFVIAQDACWKEQRFTLKYSFRNSGFAKYRPDLLGNSFAQRLLKDYNSQTYWLSASPAAFSTKAGFWPRWLGLAIGYSAKGMTGARQNPPYVNASGQSISFKRYPEYALSLDLDLSKIPVKSKMLKSLFETFGFLKIPAPGIVYGNGSFKPQLLCW